MSSAFAAIQELDVRAIDGWTLHEFAEVTSTNSLAAHLPPWSAVCARVQTEGRGRTGRHWVSDPGGLWLSVVVPTPGDAAPWALLPLAAGWAVLTVVHDLGLALARLRWPNDILTGRQKLAGILVDRFSAEAAVVGIGLNITNRPEAADAALVDQVTRLADLLPEPPPAATLLARLLAALTHEHHRLETGDAAGLCRDLNGAWWHRHVHVTLSGGRGAINGHLVGIDAHGSLMLEGAAGEVRVLPPHVVELLREIF
ncbi:MAG: biotin--[acetyl-CoA-carboxylase] ligase [Opitutaceae bacterium]|nr:biotin--[acetyl-CoA-carboxylase] ligase [Opitutaceae bacterium]